MTSQTKETRLTFEQALQELEQITADIENGAMPLEDVVAAYERGVKLLGVCRRKLGDAREALDKLDGSAPQSDGDE